MARTASIAKGGYYPTPSSVIPLIASVLSPQPGQDLAYVDPCAGDGAAVLDLIGRLHENDEAKFSHQLYTAELELSRHQALVAAVKEHGGWRWEHNALCGDAFRIIWDQGSSGCSLLYLNPPYDFDPKHKRLEERYLDRFAGVLSRGGVLVFLVPFYALAASASTLGRRFDNIECYRFPEEEFGVYKQVVLLAKKRADDLFEPDPQLVQQVKSWAADETAIPYLEEGITSYAISGSRYRSVGLHQWKMVGFDYQGILKEVRPWETTDRTGKLQRIPGVFPEGLEQDVLTRTFPVAMPPRSAHIAVGIAAGIFNGARIEPDDPKSGLPALLIKGVFDKEYRTVEERKDKQGNVKAIVQVQQPKLVTTVLDLETSLFTTIQPSADLTGATEVASMTMADLLESYGRGLMQVMLDQCPVLHDPAKPDHVIELPELARPLFRAQHHATQAVVKLLGGVDAKPKDRRFKSAVVLGEIGSGKTSVALATAYTIEAKRTLVMCPPHLLDSWKEQVEAVTPWVRTVVLSDVVDVQELAADQSDQPVLAILSRETAKLGHGVTGVSGRCPKCGAVVPPGNHARKRSRCQAQTLQKTSPLFDQLALALMPVFPGSSWIKQALPQPIIQRTMDRLQEQKKEDPKAYVRKMWPSACERLAPIIRGLLEQDNPQPILQPILTAFPDVELLCEAASTLFRRNVETNYWSEAIRFAVDLLLLADDPLIEKTARELKALWPSDKPFYSNPWDKWQKTRDVLWRGQKPPNGYYGGHAPHLDAEGRLVWDDDVVGDPKVAVQALGAMAHQMVTRGKVCDEPLFQATPEPRRYPLGTYISRRYPDLFDLLVLDEGHEYANQDSAQSHAAHRLTGLGIPTIMLTGTVMNGYAESLFINTWALSPAFREDFNDRDDIMRFVNRYGYRKRLVEDRDKDSGEVVSFGAVTDRVERRERLIGKAPGVLPLFLFQHLLPISVTLHKVDLAADIPNCREEVVSIEPDPAQKKEYERLKRVLMDQIKEDRFKPKVAGKLWGAMAHFPSYLDLATTDTGNAEGGEYLIRYPERVEEVGGSIIARSAQLPADALLPKEEWMVSQVERSLEEDRNVLVFAWHTVLLPRLSRILEERLGIKCPILDPSKVSTAKRQAWINREVVKRKRRVLVVNPVAIQTGLNNLVYFSDEIWMENPGCSPIIYRQAVGRVDRIGQTEPTRIFFPLYEDTAQTALHSLLMHKVAVSMSTDGLDAESALQAAGVGEDTGFSSFAVGRQLYELLSEGREVAIPKAPKKRRPAKKRSARKPQAPTQEELFELAMSLGE